MKSKILRTILYINAGLLLLAGCKREEDPLYGKDSSYIERTSPTLSAYGRELRSAENGWLLTLYAGKNQQYGGYNVIALFNHQ